MMQKIIQSQENKKALKAPDALRPLLGQTRAMSNNATKVHSGRPASGKAGASAANLNLE